MNKQTVATVIPLPTARALPVRTSLYSRTRGARRTECFADTLNGVSQFYVVVTNIFTDVTTITGPIFDRYEALQIAHAGGA